jgi:hypothetical protein
LPDHIKEEAPTRQDHPSRCHQHRLAGLTVQTSPAQPGGSDQASAAVQLHDIHSTSVTLPITQPVNITELGAKVLVTQLSTDITALNIVTVIKRISSLD